MFKYINLKEFRIDTSETKFNDDQVYPDLVQALIYVGHVQKSGEGMIKDNAGNVVEIYACNIPGKKTWYAQTACVYYEKDQEIEVEQDDNSGLILGITPGIFDETKWNSLDQTRLAFKCDNKGKAITGLFKED